jgi:hypothetical protein
MRTGWDNRRAPNSERGAPLEIPIPLHYDLKTARGLLLGRTSENSVMKLSEKGCGRRSEGGFGRCKETKMAFWRHIRLPSQADPRLFRQFHGEIRRTQSFRVLG